MANVKVTPAEARRVKLPPVFPLRDISESEHLYLVLKAILEEIKVIRKLIEAGAASG